MSSKEKCDAYRDELVALVYDELDTDRREAVLTHLEDCADCAARLESYRGVRDRLSDWAEEGMQAAPAAESSAPHPDGVGRREGASRTPQRFSGLSFAARLAAALLLLWIGREWIMSDGGSQPIGDRYVLLLREGEYDYSNMTPEIMRGRVAEYMNWSNEWDAKGNPMSGEKLTDEAIRFGPGASDEIDPSLTLAGFFVFAAESQAEAEAVAKSCPHLKYGGVIELRQIDAIVAEVAAGE